MKSILIALTLLLSFQGRAQEILQLGSYDPESGRVALEDQSVLQLAVEKWVGRELTFGAPEFHLHPEREAVVVSWPVAGDNISRAGMLFDIDDNNRVIAEGRSGGPGFGIKHTFTCEGSPCGSCLADLRWRGIWPYVICTCYEHGDNRQCNMKVTMELEIGSR